MALTDIHSLPDGDGVLKSNAPAGKVIAFYAGIFGAGAAAAVVALTLLGGAAVGSEARAAKVKEPATLEQKVDGIAAVVGSLQTDMGKVKCRLNIEQTCPPEPPLPVRAAGIH